MHYRQHGNPKLCSKFDENDKSVNISIRRINIKGLVPLKSVRWSYIKIINKTSNFCNDGRYRNCKVHCQNFLRKQRKVYREIWFFFQQALGSLHCDTIEPGSTFVIISLTKSWHWVNTESVCVCIDYMGCVNIYWYINIYMYTTWLKTFGELKYFHMV